MLDKNTLFLNHGSFGACAKPAFENLLYWQKRLETEPVKFLEKEIFDHLADSRQALGKYIGCSADDLVYYPNPTHTVNAVARSLKLQRGDEVLGTNHIYGALDYTWKYICEQAGASFVKAKIPLPINSKAEFLSSFLSYISRKTKVIFISHLTSMTAMIFPIKEVIQFARENGILCIIDGAHVPGQIPLNIGKLAPDIYTGACHKWMCTPKGVSFLYVKKTLQETIHPLVISWGLEMGFSGTSKFLDWHEWQGTRDMSAFLTVPAAIKFLNKENWGEINETCHELTVKTRNQFLDYLNIDPICPDDWLGQMASIQIPIKEPESLKNILLEKYKIQVPVFEWEGKVYLRFSVQAYNTGAELDCLIKAVKEILN